ncbi:MAG TPA: GNAT family N-acetyltransferase [Casimicrobiaceae bacterium]|nr:GNAT family N-acetyltransferase [Casimicrobiaceae bacterium]
MHIEHYTDADMFLVAATPAAASDPALLAFLRTWAMRTTSSHRVQRTFMATASNRKTTGFAMQRADGPVVLGACSDVAAATFADALALDYPALDGVTGDAMACEAFCARWKALTGRDSRLRVRMRNHLLLQLRPPPFVEGEMRAANADDAVWLRTQSRAFVEEIGEPMSEASLERTVRDRLDEGSYRIWQLPDGPCAFAGFSVAGPDASRVAPVYTLPASRRQGLAGALVGALCAELLAQRPQVFLLTDLANPTSNALYRRLGFEPLGDMVAYEIAPA